MKKIIFTFLLLIVGFYNVYAKDISYSMNKYDDEVFNYIEESYDSKLKKDGYVLGGSILKEKQEKDDLKYDDYQVVLVKYNKNDKLVWKYTYGNTREDYINYLEYTYDENGNIDGYLIVCEKTYDIFEENNSSNTSVFIKIDLDGKFVYEKDVTEGIVTKIISYRDDNDNIDGYIGILKTQTGSSLIKYNKNFEIVSKRDFEGTLSDITLVKENNKVAFCAVILNNNLITLDLDFSNDLVISDVSKYETYKLSLAKEGFILYGITSEVKLKNGDSSYYIINYNRSEELWETIGDTVTDIDGGTVLLPITFDNVKGYFLLYKNMKDSSYEVVKVNLDGDVLKKVKKINNSYYDIKNFYSNGSTIYFVGQINCLEDENCEYDNNSLYLVSDEDKVIEVKDDTCKNVIFVFTIILVVLIGGIIVVKKKIKK